MINKDFVVPSFLSDKILKVSKINSVGKITPKKDGFTVKVNYDLPKEEPLKDDEVIIMEENGEKILYDDWKEKDFGYDEEENHVPDYKTSDDQRFMTETKKTDCISDEPPVSEAQLKSVARMAKGLRRAEARVVLDNLPIDLIFEKIGKELAQYDSFKTAVTKAMDIIK